MIDFLTKAWLQTIMEQTCYDGPVAVTMKLTKNDSGS